jgi:hypothetical protein
MAEKEVRRMEVKPVIKTDEEEIAKAQDFSIVKTRFDEARRPISERKLFRYNQRWFFIAIVLIILILLILLEVL